MILTNILLVSQNLIKSFETPGLLNSVLFSFDINIISIGFTCIVLLLIILLIRKKNNRENIIKNVLSSQRIKLLIERRSKVKELEREIQKLSFEIEILKKQINMEKIDVI